MDWAVGEDWPAFSQRLYLPKGAFQLHQASRRWPFRQAQGADHSWRGAAPGPHRYTPALPCLKPTQFLPS